MPRSDYYIPVFDELPGHKKTRDLRKAMDWNRFEIVGFLTLFWLQVAADFPNGELPGLESLNATLREIWSAAKFELKRERIQFVAKALIDAGFIDPPDESGRLSIHDWDDGAGMFAKKRLYEREKKRAQRAAQRAAEQAAAQQNGMESVPGTPADCPSDVPGEKGKRKKETIPPNPPPAGGDFSHFQKLVMDEWRAACGAEKVEAVGDNKTEQAVATLAKQIMAGKITIEQVRKGMIRFLHLKYHGPDAAKMATWSLLTFAKNPSAYQPNGNDPKSPGKHGEMAFISMRCDSCGTESCTPLPKGSRPEYPCQRELKRGQVCSGVLRFVMETPL